MTKRLKHCNISIPKVEKQIFPIFSYTFQIEAETFVSASNTFMRLIQMKDLIGLYIHIPFCKSKCPYCDFYSEKGTEADFDSYTLLLIDKIRYWSKKSDKKVETIYFGGGTPSILGAVRLSKILCAIKNTFNVISDAEITVEINPDTGKTIDFSLLKESGFNRISIGMQTAISKELNILGRIHTSEEAKITVDRAKKAGLKNISLDLMMGIPLQSENSLKESIDFCKSCGVTHISSYILKIEEGTKFHSIKNQLTLPDEDKQAELYLFAVDYLDNIGYKQYEISNFALDGFESKHNIKYWKCEEYIGIGPSSHSFFNNKRFYYNRDMQDFENDHIQYDCDGGNADEYIMLSLRLKSGLNFDEFRARFGYNIKEVILKKTSIYRKMGYMEADDKKIYFTPKGFLVSNAIISELI